MATWPSGRVFVRDFAGRAEQLYLRPLIPAGGRIDTKEDHPSDTLCHLPASSKRTVFI